VLLGASNLALAFPTIVAVARDLVGAPIEVLAAIGHGRSWGAPSRVLLRELPGIASCGLWDELALLPPAPRTLAVVTDVGNDIAYGATTATIAGWVASCLDRLPAGARTVMTRLPLASLRAVPQWRYSAIRAMLYPRRPLAKADALRRAALLDEALVDLARTRGLSIVDADPRWYGLDPIHVRPAQRRAAWVAILGRWLDAPSAARPAARSLRRLGWVRMRRARPQRRWVIGREQCARQPSFRARDGTTVSLF
jgi:hypothetical protein